jgi:hypothetical protein
MHGLIYCAVRKKVNHKMAQRYQFYGIGAKTFGVAIAPAEIDLQISTNGSITMFCPST